MTASAMPPSRMAMNGQGPFGGGAGGGFEGFSDIFSSIFGEFMDPRAQRASAARGSDLRYDLELTLEEAFRRRRKDHRHPGAGALRGLQCVRLQRPGGGAQPARPAAAPARFARSRAFSSSSGPAPAAWARARRSPIPATPATARAARSRRASSTSTFRPGSTKAPASASPARARRACAARPRATSTCSSI